MSIKLLQSIRNDFPQFYKEYCIKDLKIDAATERNWTLIWKQNGRPGKGLSPKELSHLKYLHKDITTRGLIHPIIIWSQEKMLNVYVGRERVWFAKREGYTHISTYHVSTIVDGVKVNAPRVSKLGFNKKLLLQAAPKGPDLYFRDVIYKHTKST